MCPLTLLATTEMEIKPADCHEAGTVVQQRKLYSRREVMKTFQLGMSSLTPYHSIIMEQLWFKCRELWLDIEKFRVEEDWSYLLKAIYSDGCKFIKIHVYCNWDSVRNKKRFNATGQRATHLKVPFWNTPNIQRELLRVICSILSDSRSQLTHFEWAGIPLKPSQWDSLLTALHRSKNLQSVSFARSKLGESNFLKLESALAQLHQLANLNLADCCLSALCMQHLAELIQSQSLQHASSSWTKSLRHYVNLDDARTTSEAKLARQTLRGTLAGVSELDWGLAIRRLVLNCNPNIGDEGAEHLFVALSQEEIGIRALDFQGCGLTDKAGKQMLDVLTTSQSLLVLDARQNVEMHPELQRQIVERAQRNATMYPPHISTQLYPWNNNAKDPLENTFHYMYQLKKRFATVNKSPPEQSMGPVHSLPRIQIPLPSALKSTSVAVRPMPATSPTRLVIPVTPPFKSRSVTVKKDKKSKDQKLLELMETALNEFSKAIDKWELKPNSEASSSPGKQPLCSAKHKRRRKRNACQVDSKGQMSADRAPAEVTSLLQARTEWTPKDDHRELASLNGAVLHESYREMPLNFFKGLKNNESRDAKESESWGTARLQYKADDIMAKDVPSSVLDNYHLQVPVGETTQIFNYPESQLSDKELIDIATSAFSRQSLDMGLALSADTSNYTSTLFYTGDLLETMERVTASFENGLKCMDSFNNDQILD